MVELTKKQDKNSYLSEFERFEKTLLIDGQHRCPALREAAMGRFAELGFPTIRDEEWRFTNIAPLTQVSFQLALTSVPKELTPLKLDRLTYGAWDCYRLVFVNGSFAPELSNSPATQALLCSGLRKALDHQPQLIEASLAILPATSSDAP